MARFLILWETDLSRVPVNPAERGQLYNQMLQAVKSDMQKALKEWGLCVGNNMGYGVFEGNELDLGLMLEQYSPYIHFKTYAMVGVDEALKFSQGLMQMKR